MPDTTWRPPYDSVLHRGHSRATSLNYIEPENANDLPLCATYELLRPWPLALHVPNVPTRVHLVLQPTVLLRSKADKPLHTAARILRLPVFPIPLEAYQEL